VERDGDYAAAAERRIAATEPLPAASLAAFATAREAPRVPFASLIERGLLTAGARLVDAKRRHRALVRADGAIALIGGEDEHERPRVAREDGRQRPYGATVGSIHRIGALAQGLDACNGWAFWHVETPKGLVSIDALRAEVRAEMGTS
jgi:modification methylase